VLSYPHPVLIQKSRDPRFSDLSGTLNPSLYHNSYSFLPTLQKSELETLKTSLKAARKALANSPQHLREEREIEVEKLERALKRSESNVSRAAREERERKVLSSAMKEETHKREEGKKGWWMKECSLSSLAL
jgi:ribosomal RNA-processing protein 36